jgi:hypothetical protein
LQRFCCRPVGFYSLLTAETQLLVINLKNSNNAEVHYACCCALAFLAVRQDVRAALYEATVGPLMEALDLFVRRFGSSILVVSPPCHR